MQIEFFKKLAMAGLGLTVLAFILKAVAGLINAPILLDLTSLLRPAGLLFLGISALGFIYRYYLTSRS
jgi:hypothetical protein